MEGAVESGDRVRGNRSRPSSKQLFAAAVELIASGAGAYKATARRYSLCAADAEDAYQRGLEILITKAPTARRAELKPWLHTVIKHEALAIRRQRERLLEHDAARPRDSSDSSTPGPDEGVTERERAHQTAEALRELKQSELRCLLLKALGYSYEEIAKQTGFSWTKVNRSLTEGRRRFFDRFAQIQSGERCESFRTLISAASDGEAAPEDERQLKRHLSGCHSCRATLRGYRSLPGRLAQLLPPAPFLAALERGGWWYRLQEAIVGGGGDRAGALGAKLQQTGDLVAGQKAAAVIASTAAIAGGAAVHERGLEHRGSQRAQAERSARAHTSDSGPPAPSPAPVPQSRADPPAPEPAEGTSDRAASEQPASAAGEFDLAAGGPAPRAESAAQDAAPPANGAGSAEMQSEVADLAPAPLASGAGASDGAAPGGGEFGP